MPISIHQMTSRNIFNMMLEQSNLPTLQTRRQHAKLCQIINEATFFPEAPMLASRSTLLPTPFTLILYQLVQLIYYHNSITRSYFTSTLSIAAWNSLPSDITSATFTSLHALISCLHSTETSVIVFLWIHALY